MNIPAANVVISYFFEPLLSLVEGEISLAGLRSSADTGNSLFVFDNSVNSNLLSFTHSLAGGGGNSGESVVLEIVDPEFKFEQAFSNTRFSSLLPDKFRDPRFKSKKEPENEDTQEEKDLLKNLDKRGFRFNSDTSGSLDDIRVGGHPNIWITYGVGNDLQTWCPPFNATFKEAGVEYSKGSRVLTLTFNTTDYLIPTSIVDGTSQKYRSDPIELNQVIVGKSQLPWVIQGEEEKTNFLTGLTKARLNISNFDNTIYDLFLDYLSKVYDISKERVIILFPKVTTLFQRRLEQLEAGYYQISKNILNLKVRKVVSILKAQTQLAKELGILTRDYVDKGDINENLRGIKRNNPVYTVYSELNDRAYKSADFNTTILKTLQIYHIVKDNKNFKNHFANILDKFGLNPVCAIKFASHLQTNATLCRFLTEKGLVAAEDSEDTDPILVFGDQTLIHDYLYGGYSFEQISFDRTSLRKFIPDDLEILITDDYNKEVRNLRQDTIRVFNTGIPETIFSPISQEDKEIITKLRMPIFRYGVEDPNVLSISLDDAKTQTAVSLQLPVLAKDSLSTWGRGEIKEEFINSLSTETRETLVEYLRTYLRIASKHKEIPEEFKTEIETFESLGEEATADYIIKLHNNLAKNGANTYKIMSELTGDNILANSIRAMSVYFSMAVKGSITTLPMFWLANPYILTTPCVLFSLEPKSVGVNYSVPIQSAYTGLYTIMGYTHTITTNSVESEFLIIKDPRLITEEEATIEPEVKEELEEISNGLGQAISKTWDNIISTDWFTNWFSGDGSGGEEAKAELRRQAYMYEHRGPDFFDPTREY